VVPKQPLVFRSRPMRNMKISLQLCCICIYNGRKTVGIFMGPVDEDLVSSLCTSWRPKNFLEAVATSNRTVYSFFLLFRYWWQVPNLTRISSLSIGKHKVKRIHKRSFILCCIWESIKDSKIFRVISSDMFLEISRMQTINEAESKCW